jgi:hypothetical protein
LRRAGQNFGFHPFYSSSLNITAAIAEEWLHEFHAENRLEGDHFFLSVALDW